MAASADPFTGEVFWTDGVRAYVRCGGVDEELKLFADSRLVDVNLDCPFPNSPAFSAARLLVDEEFAVTVPGHVCVSTTLAVAWVAAWRRAAYVTDGYTAGQLCTSPAESLCAKPPGAW